MYVLIHGKDAEKLAVDVGMVVDLSPHRIATTLDQVEYDDWEATESVNAVNIIVWLENGDCLNTPNVLQIVHTRQMQEKFMCNCTPTTQPLSYDAIANLLCCLLHSERASVEELEEECG